MSISMRQSAPLPRTYAADLRRDFWSRMFGEGIQAAREGAGLSIEKAAQLAGMEFSEWAAIEEGHVPEDLNRLHAMADAMGIRYERIATMALLCREAWEL